MAKATIKQDPVPPPPKRVVLELTELEARELRTVLCNIGVGNNDLLHITAVRCRQVTGEERAGMVNNWTYKRTVDSVYFALTEAGVPKS